MADVCVLNLIQADTLAAVWAEGECWPASAPSRKSRRRIQTSQRIVGHPAKFNVCVWLKTTDHVSSRCGVNVAALIKKLRANVKMLTPGLLNALEARRTRVFT